MTHLFPTRRSSDLRSPGFLCKSGWGNQAKRMSHIAISIPRVDWKPLKGCLELQSTSRLTELLPLGGAGVCKESSAFTKHLSSGTSTASCRILLTANRLDSVHHFGHGIVAKLR